MTLYEHVAPQYRHILGLSDRERLAFLDREILLPYPAAAEVHNRLLRLFEMPKRTRMGNLLLVSKSNNGKSSIIKQFKEECGEPFVNDHNKPVKPVIVAEVPPSADEKAFYLSILEEFNAPYRLTAPAVQLGYQALHLLRQCNTRILIIDELHSLLAGSARKQSEVMNAIKRLCNQLQIPIVGVGTHDAVNVLHTDPQHASRFQVERLPLWKADRNFQRLLVGFEEILPLKRPSELYRSEIVQPLHEISEGNLGDLRELLGECGRRAIESGAERIDLGLVKSMAWFRRERGDGIRERKPDTAAGPSR